MGDNNARRRGLWGRTSAMAATIFTLLSMPVAAQTYPSHPIRLIHGFAPGGAADTLARIIGEALSKRLGQPVLVEAKTGAGGNIAAIAIAKSPADGYTIGLVTGAHAIAGALYETPPLKPAEDFKMVSTLVHYALVIAVRADHEAKTLADLIALAKKRPDAVSFGSVGFGSTHHLAGELLNIAAGTKMLHVPYRGDAQSMTALLSGDIPVVVGTPVLLASQIQGGTIRGLAVTSPQRTALLPGVPTAEEAGLKGYEVRTWAGILAPKGIPDDIVARINKEISASLADPETKASLEAAVGGETRSSTPEQMRELVSGEVARWSDVIRSAGVPLIK